jgi:hypothetical protein
MFAALLRTLEEVKIEFRNGDSTEKEKAKTADEVQGRMHNSLFALSISLLVDIYRVYSAGTNILQVIKKVKLKRK